jgi:uncharacterized protein (TIGR01777 family)
MRIVIPGGSGQVGTILARAFQARGDEVVILGRAKNGHTPWKFVQWDARTDGLWRDELDGSDVVINLAGRSVNCRYSPTNRRDILESRVESTRAVGRAIAGSSRPPALWIQASTATIYAHRYDAGNDEASGRIGGGEPGIPDTWRFSIEVATAWERELETAPTPHTRKIALRSAMTMSPDRGGIFDVLMGLVKRGLGGPAGDGRQYVSWIHHRDFVRAVDWLIARPQLHGPINVTAPNPLPNADFMRAIRSAAGVRIGLPATRWMLELGALFMRTETELILKSRRVVPGRLLADGFDFEQPDWLAAARDLVVAWRLQNR